MICKFILYVCVYFLLPKYMFPKGKEENFLQPPYKHPNQEINMNKNLLNTTELYT